MNNYQFLLQISQGMELPFLTRVDELKDITGHPFWLGTIHILRQHNFDRAYAIKPNLNLT